MHMITFFQRKLYLADYLHGLVDIHNHILPGIDDGAKTVDDSITLLKGFSEMGVVNFICTPHIIHNHYDNNPASILKANEKLQSALDKEKELKINLDYAAEHMIDDNFEHILEEKEIMPMGKEHLLIEMSYLQPSFNFDTAVEQIAKHKYYPILAHPERYMYYHGKYGKYLSMKSSGILFQLNLLSLSSEPYGSEVNKIAKRLLEDGLIDFVGTDVHNIGQLGWLKEVKLSKKTLNRLLPIIENTIRTFY